MDFELAADQVALADAARALLDGRASSAAVRAIVAEGGGLDRNLWSAMVEQGWAAIEVPEGDAGLGLGAVEAALLAEVVGAHVAPAPFTDTVLAVDALRRGGDERWRSLVAGDAIACVAWSVDPSAVHAEAVGGRWRVTGRADPVPFAPSADVAIVAATDPDGRALFAVDIADPPRREPAMDRTRELGWLELDGVEAVRLGGEDEAHRLLDRGATFGSAELLGASARVLDMSVEYAKERVQFGQPIGSFQAVKHRCADMLVDVEGMRSSVPWAAWCVGHDDEERSIAASTAKTWCADASKRVMASGFQVHGGIGFTWEHDLHLYMKRAQLEQTRFGGSAFHRDRLAGLLRSRVQSGQSVL